MRTACAIICKASRAASAVILSLSKNISRWRLAGETLSTGLAHSTRHRGEFISGTSMRYPSTEFILSAAEGLRMTGKGLETPSSAPHKKASTDHSG